MTNDEYSREPIEGDPLIQDNHEEASSSAEQTETEQSGWNSQEKASSEGHSWQGGQQPDSPPSAAWKKGNEYPQQRSGCFSGGCLVVLGIAFLSFLLICGIFTMGIVGNVEGGGREIISQEVVLSADQLEQLDVSSSSGKVRFYETDGQPYARLTGESFSLFRFGDGPSLSVMDGGGQTSVKVKGSFVLLFSFNSNMVLELYLPKDCVQDLKVTLSSGTVDVSDMKLEKLDVSVSSGKIQGDGLEAKKLQATLSSGTVDLSGAFDEMVGKVSSGRLEIQSEVLPSRVQLSASSGKITLQIPDAPEGFTIDYKLSSGRFSSSFDTQDEISGKSGTFVYGKGEGDYQISVSSGTIRIDEN